MSRDVELVIRAKDAATQAIESVKDALKDLTGVQDDVAKSASKTDNLLGELGRQLHSLNAEAKGLAALGKVAGELDKAGAAVGSLDSSVRRSTTEFAKLARESAAAAANADRLRGTLEAERNALAANSQAQRDARKELTAANRLVREAVRNQERYNKELAATPETKRSPGLRSAGAFIEADISASRAKQAQLTTEIANYKRSVDLSRDAIKGLEPQVAAAAAQQRKLSQATEKTSDALGKSRSELAQAKTELSTMSGMANQASSALGGMALNQQKVTESSARMAAELARTKARIEGLNQASKTQPKATVSADVAGNEQQRRKLLELRREWVNSQAEVKRLGEAMRSAAQPTAEMGSAMGRAQVAARLAKQEYQAQQVALRNLAGSAQGSFAAFDQAAVRMAVTSGNLTRVLGTTAPSANFAAAAIRPIAPAAQAAGAAMAGSAVGANSMRTGLRGVTTDASSSTAVLQRIRGEVLALTAAYVGLHGAISQIGNVVKAFMSLEAAQNRLGSVFNQDTQRVGQELGWLERQAERLGISFQTLSEEYGKFAIAANAANFTSEATRKIFLSVAEAGRVNKLSAEDMAGVFRALQQMISKGKVSAEELRQQLGERLSGAFNIFADALGLTTAELDKMMQAGEVLANQTNLLKFADELDKRFGPQLAASLRSTSAEIGRFYGNVFQSQLRVAEGGFIEGFTAGLRELNEWFASRDGRDFFLSIGAALGRFAAGLAQLPQYFSAIQAVVVAFVGLKLASVFTGIIASIRQTQGSLTAAAASFFTWNGNVAAARAQIAAFTGTTAATRGPLANLVLQLRLAQLGMTMLGVRATVAQVGLTALRSVAAVLVGTFRLLWSVIGGLPGLVFTGLTLAFGHWLTSVKDTTSAIDEHKRIMGEVIAAYEKVTDKTKDWQKEIKNVSLDQVNANIRAMRKQFQDAKDEVADYGNMLSLVFMSDKDSVKAIIEVRKAFIEGNKSAADFVKTLEAVYAGTKDDKLRAFAEGLLEIARKARDSQRSLGEASVTGLAYQSSMEGLKEDADRAGVSIENLTEAAEGSASALSNGAYSAKTYNDALTDLKSHIPALAAEMKRLKDLSDISSAGWIAIIQAIKSGDLDKLGQAVGTTFRALGTVVSADQNAAVEQIAKNTGVTAEGIHELMASEGFRDKAYRNDPSEPWTIGYGHTGAAGGIQPYEGMVITPAQGIETFGADLAMFAAQVEKFVDVPITPAMKAALVSLQFNSGGLGASDGRRLILDPLNRGDYAGAQEGIRKFRTTGSNQDLSARRSREAAQFGSQGFTSPEIAAQEIEAAEKRNEKLVEYNRLYTARINDAQFEILISKLSGREQAIQTALRTEHNAAIAAGTELTEAQRQKIIATTGALYDQQNPRAAAIEAETKVNDLLDLRRALQEQMQLASEQGNTEHVDALRLRIEELNLQLLAAIENAIAMHQALGGPEADAAIAKLQTTAMEVGRVDGNLNSLGLSTQQVGQLTNSFADGVVGVFDQFAQAVASGENAMQALGKAFLQFAADFLREMAQMILKTIMLKAIQTALGMPTVGLPTGHTGGVVGSKGIGVGNSRRSASPAMFAYAMRYHNGGIAGLRPNEVPAILKRNEEVLTEADPRHVMNQRAAPASSAQATRHVLVMDEQSALNHLNSAAGEKVMLHHIKRNAATIKRMMS